VSDGVAVADQEGDEVDEGKGDAEGVDDENDDEVGEGIAEGVL
jgi:hypothetical protein